MAGVTGARMVLQNPEIDAAVLETPRRGIITRGLAFDWCDVGAVLNVDDDHIGMDGIHSIDEMARVKGLVAESARKTLVLKGDDERCRAMAAGSKAERICYVSMTPGQGTAAEQHIAAGEMVVTLRSSDSGSFIDFHHGS